MKQLKNYEACEIEIVSLADVITSSGGFDGKLDLFYSEPADTLSHDEYEWIGN